MSGMVAGGLSHLSHHSLDLTADRAGLDIKTIQITSSNSFRNSDSRTE